MIDRIDRNACHASYRFDSLADMARYIETAPNTWGGQNESRTWEQSKRWDLNAGYDSAWEMARWGWLEGAKQAKQALKAAFATPRTSYAVNKMDVYGSRPDIPSFLGGAPNHMIRKEHKIGAQPILTLYVPVNAMANVDAQCMRNFGLGVAQYVNALQTKGTRVQVYAVMRSKVSGWGVCHAVQVKRADQPLDLAVLSFAIGHPAMFRRLGFALRERCAAPTDTGYGRSDALKLSDLIAPERGAIILNGMKDADTIAQTPEAALDYITRAIEEAQKA